MVERELVVARYTEDIGWLDNWPDVATVYNKGPRLDRPDDPRIDVIELPNRGREAGTWLHHICHNYHDLAAWTFFAQATPHAGPADLRHRVQIPYRDTTPLSPHYMAHWPGERVTKHDHVEVIAGTEIRWGSADWHGGREPDRNREWLAAVWRQYFLSPQPEPIWYGYGAEYAVPRHRITDRPLVFWRWLRDVCLRADHSPAAEQTATSGWGLECVWGYLWGDAAEHQTHTIHRRGSTEDRLRVAAELCPAATGCSCGPRTCGAPDRPGLVSIGDCHKCQIHAWWETGTC